MIRWPGQIKPGHGLERDRLRASTGSRRCSRRPAMPDIKDKLLKGYERGRQDFKVHLDGYNQLPLPDRTEADKSRAQGVLLFQRRRRSSSRCATRTGRSCSWSSGRRARCESGPSRSPRCALAQALRPARRPVRAGGHHLQHLLRLVDRPRVTCSCRRRRYVLSSSRPSRNSRPARGRRASASMQIMEAIAATGQAD